MERVTRIELALSAWEPSDQGRSEPLTSQARATRDAVVDPSSPWLRHANGTVILPDLGRSQSSSVVGRVNGVPVPVVEPCGSHPAVQSTAYPLAGLTGRAASRGRAARGSGLT